MADRIMVDGIWKTWDERQTERERRVELLKRKEEANLHRSQVLNNRMIVLEKEV